MLTLLTTTFPCHVPHTATNLNYSTVTHTMLWSFEYNEVEAQNLSIRIYRKSTID